MYPAPSNLYDIRWGSLWFIARANASSQWALFETCGPALFVQTQQVLKEQVSPEDRTYDGTAIGPVAYAADGVWGTQTLRRMWAYVSKRPSPPTTIMAQLASLARARPSTVAIPPWLVKLALLITYRGIAQRDTDIQLAIAPNGAPLVGSSLNLPVRTEAQAAAIGGLTTQIPTAVPFDHTVPRTDIASIEALRARTGEQNRRVGPWTVAVSPLRLPDASVATFTPERPAPQLPAPSDSTEPIPDERALSVVTGDAAPVKTPQAPGAPRTALASFAASVTSVGAAVKPALPYLGAATALVALVAVVRHVRASRTA